MNGKDKEDPGYNKSNLLERDKNPGSERKGGTFYLSTNNFRQENCTFDNKQKKIRNDLRKKRHK